MKQYLECGKIINTHGISGAVKVSSACDTPYDLAELENLYIEQLGVYRKLTVTSASVYKDTVIMTFEGINDIDSATRLKNRTVFADRSDIYLEEGAYFLADIIGLPVIDAETQRVYGVIEGVNTNTPQLLYEVKTENGDVKLLPAVDAFIKEVKLESGVYVTPIQGLLDD